MIWFWKFAACGLPLSMTSSTVSLNNISAVESFSKYSNCPIMVLNLIVKHSYRYIVNNIWLISGANFKIFFGGLIVTNWYQKCCPDFFKCTRTCICCESAAATTWLGKDIPKGWECVSYCCGYLHVLISCWLCFTCSACMCLKFPFLGWSHPDPISYVGMLTDSQCITSFLLLWSQANWFLCVGVVAVMDL